MSADNGIYVLKTKDGQCRIVHAQAIENIYDYQNSSRYDALEVVRVWGDCKYTKNFDTVMKIASSMDKENCTEYGIRIFEFKKTWKHVVQDAKVLAEEKLKTIGDSSSYNDLYNKKICEKILDM